ncbi:LAGLIDADG family homing endonuclease [Piscibacillus salipiscarius]|uniref:LAGLIDADG family homing endonuclease n=1 Tax=Piscibacillus salipiscarius TaxID=299480 RepID=UPI0006D176D7|nr:LAGLIDADG family homing endonuclease [Piscibacillus salipiscarius]
MEDIRKELDSNHPIRINNKTGVYNLIINSKLLKNELMIYHKVTHNKSIDAVFPDVPKGYLSHFIRGYFDGDGHIYKSGYLICFVGGSKEFMTSLRDILAKESFNTRIIIEKPIKGFSTYLKNI